MDSISNIKNAKILYQTSYLTIAHTQAPETIVYKLSGYLDKPNAEDFFEKILKAIDETAVRFIVADLTDFKGSNLNLAKYANEVWIPKVAGKGITHVAMNTPKSEFGAFISKIAAGQKAQGLILFKHYKDLQDAFTWIKEEEKKG